MSIDYNTAPQGGLRFFGIVSASMSHEIKNVLAVISESAGLMEDLLLAAERGMPQDEGRLNKMVKRIQAHVVRGDGIVRNLNAFAHSVDQPFRQCDVFEVTRLAGALVKRMLDMQGISLNTTAPADPALVKTAPFFLKNLIWLLIESAVENLGDAKTLHLVAEKTDTGAHICVSGFEAPVRRMTCNSGFFSLRTLSSARPSISGICKSSMIAS